MIRYLIAFFSLCIALNATSQTIISPSEYFGYPLGTYFSRHHQVVDYFRELEKNSNGMLWVEEYGQTNEKRELVMAFISTAENMKRLEEIRSNHAAGKDEKVAIVWLSYNVHGNESAGTEASMQTAFELLTLKQEWLKNVLVIMDPCINPDGRDRYVNWYNQMKNEPYDVDQQTAEHDEPWPSGRPNHYLFDLNRDWAWLTQVESQQRIKLYNTWMPHVHVDFHEQGMDDPYYFAPAAEPYHEVITDWQREFQNGIGKNNAKYFDQNGWFYFTREIFDLLYPSYGDTYPMYNGAVGMTYEQGGSGRGGLGVVNSEGDTLRLTDRIAHHHTSGLSTVEYASIQKEKLISEYINFTNKKDYKYKTYIVGGNPEKVAILSKLLDQHEIIYTYGNGETVKGYDYKSCKNGSMKTTTDHIYISTMQKRGTLANVLFEPTTKLSDSLTYDITAWSLPYAYGLDCIASEIKLSGTSSKAIKAVTKEQEPKNIYAYLIRWESMTDARFLSSMLSKGVRVRYSDQAFTFGDKHYKSGTLIVVRAENSGLKIDSLVNSFCLQNGISYETTTTGMVDTGKDFGSSSVHLVKPLQIALLTGEGTSSLNTGEVWHFFEKELKYPIHSIQSSQLSPKSLETMNVLIVPEGMYSSITETLKPWISEGGKVIAMGDALAMFTTENGFALKSKQEKPADEEKEDRHEHAHIGYGALERESVKEMITGAIFKCKVETSNPIAFGYDDTYFTLKLSANAYEWMKDGGNVVYLEKEAKPVSGFAGSSALIKQPETLIIGQENMGAGCLIYMVDNPLFRGFWENGKLMFVNALFFSNN